MASGTLGDGSRQQHLQHYSLPCAPPGPRSLPTTDSVTRHSSPAVLMYVNMIVVKRTVVTTGVASDIPSLLTHPGRPRPDGHNCEGGEGDTVQGVLDLGIVLEKNRIEICRGRWMTMLEISSSETDGGLIQGGPSIYLTESLKKR